MEEKEPITKISGKEYSPLIIRRINTKAGVLFTAIISDDNLDDLDNVVRGFVDRNSTPTKIQEARNLAGALTEKLLETYYKTEGVAVILYADKLMISSLWGDFMSHEMCRIELYSLLNMMTGV